MRKPYLKFWKSIEGSSHLRSILRRGVWAVFIGGTDGCRASCRKRTPGCRRWKTGAFRRTLGRGPAVSAAVPDIGVQRPALNPAENKAHIFSENPCCGTRTSLAPAECSCILVLILPARPRPHMLAIRVHARCRGLALLVTSPSPGSRTPTPPSSGLAWDGITGICALHHSRLPTCTLLAALQTAHGGRDVGRVIRQLHLLTALRHGRPGGRYDLHTTCAPYRTAAPGCASQAVKTCTLRLSTPSRPPSHLPPT